MWGISILPPSEKLWIVWKKSRWMARLACQQRFFILFSNPHKIFHLVISGLPSCLLPRSHVRVQVRNHSNDWILLICMKMNMRVKLMSIWKVLHRDSFRNRGRRNMATFTHFVLLLYTTHLWLAKSRHGVMQTANWRSHYLILFFFCQETCVIIVFPFQNRLHSGVSLLSPHPPPIFCSRPNFRAARIFVRTGTLASQASKGKAILFIHGSCLKLEACQGLCIEINISNKQTWVKIPTGRRQTSWPFTKRSSGEPRTNLGLESRTLVP